MAECSVCFHHCKLAEGQRGLCLARKCVDGRVIAESYGRVTSLALDPIEKKPLRRFFPGSSILSVGSYGCNLRCPFCQNYEISYGDAAGAVAEGAREMSPGEVAELALSCRDKGNIGVAFTYNEPLAGYEFVRDTARLVQEAGLKTVLVTNGTATEVVEEKLLPYIDAMNVDLKAFSDVFYRDFVGGSRQMVMDFIRCAAGRCHIEVTTLIIPGENDSEAEMEELSLYLSAVAKESGCEIPLHITRFFPRFHLTDRLPTPVDTLYRLAEVAGRHLSDVFVGNV